MQEGTRKGSGLQPVLDIWSRRKWLAICAFAAPFVGVAGLAVFLPNVYRATATVLVERQQMPEALARASLGEELETRLESINQRILSRARLEELIRRFDLYPEIRIRAPREAVIERLKRDIQLQLKGVDQSSGRGATIAFALSYRGKEPTKVAEVTNTLASFYVAEDQRVREKQTAGTAEFLKLQLEAAKKRLDEQERRVGTYKKQHGRELPEQMEANLAALERLNSQLRLNTESQIRAIERRDDLARQLADARVRGIAGDPDSPASRLARLKSELAELGSRYSDKHPDVIRLKMEIKSLEQQSEPAPSGSRGEAPRAADPALLRLQERIRSADLEVRTLETEAKGLRVSIDGFQRGVEQAPQRDQELRGLSRDYIATKDLYDALTKQYGEARIAESLEKRKEGEQFAILDTALIPESPAGPDRRRLLLLGFVLAAALAAGAVAVVEQLDTTFHSLKDLREFTRVPVLVRIPSIVTRADTRRRRLRACLAALPAMLVAGMIVGVSYLLAASDNPLIWRFLLS